MRNKSKQKKEDIQIKEFAIFVGSSRCRSSSSNSALIGQVSFPPAKNRRCWKLGDVLSAPGRRATATCRTLRYLVARQNHSIKSIVWYKLSTHFHAHPHVHTNPHFHAYPCSHISAFFHTDSSSTFPSTSIVTCHRTSTLSYIFTFIFTHPHTRTSTFLHTSTVLGCTCTLTFPLPLSLIHI